MIVHVYRNLHKDQWSVKHKNKVIMHRDYLILENASFHVQPAGRARVLKEKKKNVHAYVKGELVLGKRMRKGKAARYNPYVADYFFDSEDGTKLEETNRVFFNDNGTITYK